MEFFQSILDTKLTEDLEADRNILADQAYNSFSSFDEDAYIRPEEINQRTRVSSLRSFRRSGENEEPYFGDILFYYYR